MWTRICTEEPRYCYTITSNRYVVEITGGSIIIKDRTAGVVLKRHSGHKYLYTGDIHPDETQCFALENGKHFYVYSLKDGELVKRVTLPKGYEAMDVYGFYEGDGTVLSIPAQKWVAIRGHMEGYYEHVLFRYETRDYTLLEKVADPEYLAHGWVQIEDEEPDPEEAAAFWEELGAFMEKLEKDGTFLDEMIGLGRKPE